ncbi:MAG: sialate O-acetylesterase [Opitutales bacterium]|nr:sialate O-acetylesterase [Opitutales bacterium]
MKILNLLFLGLLAFAGTLNAKTFTLFILTGQSNSLGAIKGNFADPEKMKPEPKLLFWHKNFGAYCTGTPSKSWGKIEPQKESQIVMGPEYGFAQTLQARAATRFKPSSTGILKASRDGGGNGEWVSPDGLAYVNLMVAARESLAALPALGFDKVEVAALLYLQGESNKGEEIPAAGTRFKTFFETLKKDLSKINVPGLRVESAQMKAVVGEPASFWGKDASFAGTTSVEELKKIVGANKKIFIFVPTRDLPKIKSGDNLGVHYDGNAQLEIGRRFAEAYLKILK